MRKISTEEFIQKAIRVHGNKYDYSKTHYLGNKNKIIIICPIHGEFEQRAIVHLNGGCWKCGVEKRSITKTSNTTDFIQKAKSIHGSKYNYDSVNYVNSYTKVTILCFKHGIFEQCPLSHLQGKGCLKCGTEEKSKRNTYDTNDFIQKAIRVHGDKYDYSKVRYLNSKTKITIICKTHGCFEQLPASHLSGKGCKLCAGVALKDTTKFIFDAIKVHGNVYDYSKVNYINCKFKVTIICEKHGEFEQLPPDHLSGKGCLRCSIENKRITIEDFIKRAIDVHGNTYDYSNTRYVDTKVAIVCYKHGEFLQESSGHLSGRGCFKCGKTISYIGNRWLDSINIPNDIVHREVRGLIPGRQFRVDGFVPETNTIYEFYGDSIHGNPTTCNLDDMSSYGVVYRDLYNRTIEREKIFKDAGFNLITMWESDYRKQLLQEFVSNGLEQIKTIPKKKSRSKAIKGSKKK